jgi:hypothetical protein
VNFPGEPASLWAAPNAIDHICGPNSTHTQCTAALWTSNVKIPPAPNPPTTNDHMAPVLEDIENCALPSVSWAIPDAAWSDHGHNPGNYLGPAWVAAIVNTVGTNGQCQPGTLDAGETFWNNTVIIVVWDDWGGFYDHVMPWSCSSSTGKCNGYSNVTGQQFVYGFRVPMLVISAYNKHTTNGGFTGYISGACGQTGLPSCPNEQPQYVHDFGSILNFIEYALGQNGVPLHFSGQLATSGVSPSYFYADALAPDGPNNPACGALCPYSLSDFFNFTQSPTTFTTIPLPSVLAGYPAEYFENYSAPPNDPMVPDED